MSKVSVAQNIIDVIDDYDEVEIKKGSMVYDQLKQCVNGYEAMREALKDCITRMDGARSILHKDEHSQWLMLTCDKAKQILKESE